MSEAPSQPILVAGATGDLGGRVTRALISRGASVRFIQRPSSGSSTSALTAAGAQAVEAAHDDGAALERACEGVSCVVSTLNGLEPVILEAQTRLMDAAIAAGVPRFIPSDYSADLFRIEPGKNRNFDLRRRFAERLDAAPIAATSILNGAFADMLADGQAPLIRSKAHRVLYWSHPDQMLDFTTKDDTAAFTAAAAMDPATPRFLRIAGDVVSARDIARIMSDLTGESYELQSAGGLGLLRLMIKVLKVVKPGSGEVFPPWQGMQYVENMFSGEGKLEPLDNDRYPDVRFTDLRTVLAGSDLVGERRAAA